MRPAWLVVDARHEAAHAVVAMALGVEVASVTIEGLQAPSSCGFKSTPTDLRQLGLLGYIQ